MSMVKKRVGCSSAYIMLSEFSDIWSSYNTDKLSQETLDCYYNFIAHLESDAVIPKMDCMTDIEIYIIGEDFD